MTITVMVMVMGRYVYIRKRLVEEIERRGLDLAEFVNEAVEAALFGGEAPEAPSPAEAVEVRRELERLREEMTQELEYLRERISELASQLEELREQASPKRRKGGRSAMDILKEQGFISEKEVREKLRNPDAFFAKLEREGAVILEGAYRVAVDPQLYEEFKEKIGEVDTAYEDKMRQILGDKLLNLLKALYNAGLIVFDDTKKKWVWI